MAEAMEGCAACAGVGYHSECCPAKAAVQPCPHYRPRQRIHCPYEPCHAGYPFLRLYVPDPKDSGVPAGLEHTQRQRVFKRFRHAGGRVGWMRIPS